MPPTDKKPTDMPPITKPNQLEDCYDPMAFVPIYCKSNKFCSKDEGPDWDNASGNCVEQECGIMDGKSIQCIDKDFPNCYLNNYQTFLGNKKGICGKDPYNDKQVCNDKYSLSGKCQDKNFTLPILTPSEKKYCLNGGYYYDYECGLMNCENQDTMTIARCANSHYCNLDSPVSGICESVANYEGRKCASEYGRDCPA
eukprot:NODE_89_length_21781_cov_0.895836.p14 type:complete len:198 gc:universal NODE_89_length_21781_cov_0.895836:10497-9904(-)